MVFRILFFMIIPFIGFSQGGDLQFNRVIDTVLVAHITDSGGFVEIKNKFVGDSISPPSGKVWKVNNILYDKGTFYNQNNNYVECVLSPSSNIGYNYEKISGGIDFIKSGEELDLFRMNYPEGPNGYLPSASNVDINYPIWMSNTSFLRIFIQQSVGTNLLSNPSYCDIIAIKRYKVRALVSIMEFNIVQ